MAMTIPITDSHVHIAGSYRQADNLLRALDENSIGEAVIFASPVQSNPTQLTPHWYARTINRTWLGQILVRLAPHTPMFKNRLQPLNNDDVLRLAREVPDRLHPLYFVNPYLANQLAALQEAVEHNHAVGVKLHLWVYDMSLLHRRLQPIFEYADKHRLIVLIDLGAHGRAINELGVLARTYREINFIVPHMPPPLRRILLLAQSHSNIYLDTSGPQVSPHHIAQAVRTIGPERVIFGSDTLTPRPDDMAESLRTTQSACRELSLDDRTKELIFSGNIRRLIKQVVNGSHTPHHEPPNVPSISPERHSDHEQTLSVTLTDSPPQSALGVVLAEYDGVRRTIESLLNREGNLVSQLLIGTAGIAAFILGLTNKQQQVILLLVASLVTAAFAWAIELQFWDILWHQYYIGAILQPLARRLVGSLSPVMMRFGLLGLDGFIRELPIHPRGLLWINGLGGLFWQILVISPSVGFLAGSVYVQRSIGG